MIGINEYLPFEIYTYSSLKLSRNHDTSYRPPSFLICLSPQTMLPSHLLTSLSSLALTSYKHTTTQVYYCTYIQINMSRYDSMNRLTYTCVGASPSVCCCSSCRSLDFTDNTCRLNIDGTICWTIHLYNQNHKCDNNLDIVSNWM